MIIWCMKKINKEQLKDIKAKGEFMSVNLEAIKKDCVSQINQYVEMKTLEKIKA